MIKILELPSILAKSLLFVLAIFTFAVNARADTLVPQAGANPIVINQTAQTDNLIVLMAAGSAHNSSLTIDNYGPPKHAWVNNFLARTTDYMTWTVSVPVASYYHFNLLA